MRRASRTTKDSRADRDAQAELVNLQIKYDKLEDLHDRQSHDLVIYQRSVAEDAMEKATAHVALLDQRDEMAGELATIRASLSEVAVFDADMVGSYLTRCVSELVRDHEELEARIDAAVLVGRTDQTRAMVEVLRLLQGGTRTPDSPEGL